MTDEFDDVHGASDEEISRSEMKRRSTARQKIGEELGNMPLSAIRSFGLPAEVVSAFEEYHQATKNEARRRQMQYIGRLLREVDTSEIESRLSDYHTGRASATADFHHLERLRDSLMEERAEALDEVLTYYPTADIQYIRQLVRNGRKEQAAEKPLKSARTLFKYLRDLPSEA